MTTVVNLYKEPYDVYIGRGSKWGNPFSHKKGTKAKYTVSNREYAIQCYAYWIKSQPHLIDSLHELKGKRLGCYCKPKPCHGDILVRLVEDLT